MSKTTPDTTDGDVTAEEYELDDDEVVHIATGSSFGGGGIYHTDPDCRYLDRANNQRELPPGVKPIRTEPCSHCFDLDG